MPKAKILFVDDEMLILKAFKRLFETNDYYVRVAISGTEAIELAKVEKFNIVYTDLVMPDVSGVEVCKEIKKISPDTQVVLISGHPAQLEKHKGAFIKAGGREELLRKPLLGTQVLKITEEILQETDVKESF